MGKARLHFQMFEGWKMKIRQFRCSLSLSFLNDVRETKSEKWVRPNSINPRGGSTVDSFLLLDPAQRARPGQSNRHETSVTVGALKDSCPTSWRDTSRRVEQLGETRIDPTLRKTDRQITRPTFNCCQRAIYFLLKRKEKKRRETILKNLRWDFLSGSIMWRE